MPTVAEKMHELGMLRTEQRNSSVPEYRVMIMEKRVNLNGRRVTHTEVQWPNKPGNYILELQIGSTIYREVVVQ